MPVWWMTRAVKAMKDMLERNRLAPSQSDLFINCRTTPLGKILSRFLRSEGLMSLSVHSLSTVETSSWIGKSGVLHMLSWFGLFVVPLKNPQVWFYGSKMEVPMTTLGNETSHCWHLSRLAKIAWGIYDRPRNLWYLLLSSWEFWWHPLIFCVAGSRLYSTLHIKSGVKIWHRWSQNPRVLTKNSNENTGRCSFSIYGAETTFL